MSDIIECTFDISIDHPGSCGIGPCQAKNFFDRVVTSSARAKPVADPFEAGLPKWFQGVFHHGLDTSIGRTEQRYVKFHRLPGQPSTSTRGTIPSDLVSTAASACG